VYGNGSVDDEGHHGAISATLSVKVSPVAWWGRLMRGCASSETPLLCTTRGSLRDARFSWQPCPMSVRVEGLDKGVDGGYVVSSAAFFQVTSR